MHNKPNYWRFMCVGDEGSPFFSPPDMLACVRQNMHMCACFHVFFHAYDSMQALCTICRVELMLWDMIRSKLSRKGFQCTSTKDFSRQEVYKIFKVSIYKRNEKIKTFFSVFVIFWCLSMSYVALPKDYVWFFPDAYHCHMTVTFITSHESFANIAW